MSTPSTLTNLRQYRFKKNVINSTAAAVTETDASAKSSWGGIERVPGRKRIHTAVDSSGDEASNTNTIKSPPPQKPKLESNSNGNLAIKEKEEKLIYVKKMEPDFDTMLCQDALLRCNWNANDAIEYLRKNCQKGKSCKQKQLENGGFSIQAHNQHSNGDGGGGGGGGSMNHSKQKRKARRRSESNSDCSDEQSRPQERVFESDDEDSDTETVYELTKDRRGVLKFLNEATNNELQMIKTCSTKKIDALLEVRPFDDWPTLVRILQSHRNLSTDLLNHTQEFLKRRNNMVKIMKKCDKFAQRLENAFRTGQSIISKQPANLSVDRKLADYQMIGLNWLCVMHREGMNGILADEMGLGKTIQVISFLAYLKETGQAHGTHLIVVPSSTMDNWFDELMRWCPSLNVDKYYGNSDERRSLRIKYAKNLHGVDIILTTYHMVQSTPEERKMFRVMKIQYVVFDEAHMLKNWTTQRYANLIRINAERRLLLTGTPLQNNLLELMSLLCFVMPSLFANNTEDIKSLFQKNYKLQGEDVTSFEQTQIAKAKQIMKPFILRRLKCDVLDSLPTKTEVLMKVPMLQTQKSQYLDFVQQYSNDSGVIQGETDIPAMSIMMDLRKLANHPLLLRYYYTDAKLREFSVKLSTHPLYKKNREPQYIFEALAIQSDFQVLQLLERYNLAAGNQIPDNLILNSGKCKRLDSLLPTLKQGGHRVLIFSQFTMMLDILERYLDIRDYSFSRIDGQTPVTERQELIYEFNRNDDIFVFLLSTKAGGLGINLTAADTAIIHDIDFNPYNDKQAEDRCHRMGQKRPVTIYRLISEETLEEGMHMIAEEKLNLEKELTSEKGDLTKDHKSMVRLLTMAIGINEEKAETILSKSQTIDPENCGEEYYENF